MTVSVA